DGAGGFLGIRVKPTATARTAAAAANGANRRRREAETTLDSRISFTPPSAGGASRVDARATARRQSSHAARWAVIRLRSWGESVPSTQPARVRSSGQDFSMVFMR